MPSGVLMGLRFQIQLQTAPGYCVEAGFRFGILMRLQNPRHGKHSLTQIETVAQTRHHQKEDDMRLGNPPLTRGRPCNRFHAKTVGFFHKFSGSARRCGLAAGYQTAQQVSACQRNRRSSRNGWQFGLCRRLLKDPVLATYPVLGFVLDFAVYKVFHLFASLTAAELRLYDLYRFP
jgi:hypothetical protein